LLLLKRILKNWKNHIFSEEGHNQFEESEDEDDHDDEEEEPSITIIKKSPAAEPSAKGAICPKCKKVARIGAKFCAGCGTKLERSCISCGRQLKATSKFCPQCGTKAE